ncbi:hypothetical protein B0G93_102283 [Bacillus sp. V-88]|uniref:hypothetical protein n=1 Tax=Rossellomorea vietnamensis TaxID=218284 RepID=UPI0005566459|nr:hypothetical protein [Rossellomorea vietnamensis]OXS63840.1 hypothetical protein B1B00_03815 [Bacillus sp. DSM 27956]PRX78920.1 hypothetical protein B0G93_102283 [Bacillus sp. V-88]SLK15480.1 hypothetical protein SAMN06295884_102283 [Bacillus sp. V-88]
MKKEKMYPRFWLFAIYFTCFWILYGFFILFQDVVIEDHFDSQPIYLIGGMTIMLARSVQEFKKSKRQEGEISQK